MPKWNLPGVRSISVRSSRTASPTCWMTASPMGIIMAVVAVLETHMETNAEAHMKPRMTLDGLVPTRATIWSANRR